MPIISNFPSGISPKELEAKQDKLTGFNWQFVGFNDAGTAEAKDIESLKDLLGLPAYTPIAGATEVLNDNSWEVIDKVSAANMGPNYWSVGDCKSVALSGTAGELSLDTTYCFFILGFNHNSSIEGPGITFGGFKSAITGGVDITLVHKTAYYGVFKMNLTNTNKGGWKESNMRFDILGSTKVLGGDATSDTATSPKENTLMSCLPADLRAVMKPMIKYTDNTGGYNPGVENITKTIDYLPLLSYFEVLGIERGHANFSEANFQKQYAYYAAGNSKIKCHHTDGSKIEWWLRSPRRDSSEFCGVSTAGTNYSDLSSHSHGLAPIFKV